MNYAGCMHASIGVKQDVHNVHSTYIMVIKTERNLKKKQEMNDWTHSSSLRL